MLAVARSPRGMGCFLRTVASGRGRAAQGASEHGREFGSDPPRPRRHRGSKSGASIRDSAASGQTRPVADSNRSQLSCGENNLLAVRPPMLDLACLGMAAHARNHVVTRGHLELFARNGTLMCHFSGGTVKPLSPKDVAVRTDFYVVKDGAGARDTSWEIAMSRLEATAVPALRRVPDWPLSARDRNTITEYRLSEGRCR